MKNQIIQATSSPHAMPAETNDRRFTVFNDGIDATEVQERLDWKALRDMITVDTSLLEFVPTGQHQVAALANLGAELVQEVKAYRPGFAWKSSPAEIVGALIEEMAAPGAVAAPQVEDVRAAFEAHITDNGVWPRAAERSVNGGYRLMATSVAWNTWLAAFDSFSARATFAATPVERAATGPTDCDMIDFLELTGSVHWDLENCTIRFDIPDDLMSGSVREILKAAIAAYGEKA